MRSDTNSTLPIGFLLHKDIKYDTLDKKFQYYQENRDEYYELKQTLMRMVLETSVKSLYDELNSIEEYMEIIEHAEDKELGMQRKYCFKFNSLVIKGHLHCHTTNVVQRLECLKIEK